MSKDTVKLKLVIDNKRGIILLAEADEKFVDALTDEVNDTDTLFYFIRQTAPAGSSIVNLCDSFDALYGASSDSDTSSDSSSEKPAGIYMITDDLKFKPMSALSMMNHMLTLSVDGPDALEEKVVQLSLDEVAKLVRASLHSKKVLTDFFLNKTDAKAEAEAEVDGVKKEEFVAVFEDEAAWH